MVKSPHDLWPKYTKYIRKLKPLFGAFLLAALRSQALHPPESWFTFHLTNFEPPSEDEDERRRTKTVLKLFAAVHLHIRRGAGERRTLEREADTNTSASVLLELKN